MTDGKPIVTEKYTKDYLYRYTTFADGYLKPTQDELAKIFWILCRDTSVTYIERMLKMLEAFNPGFESYLKKVNDTESSWFDFMQNNYYAISGIKDGLAKLKIGDTSGYEEIKNSLTFVDPFVGMRGMDWDYSRLGQREGDASIGLWVWMDHLSTLADNTKTTLESKYWFPEFDVSKFLIPEDIGAFPLRTGIFVQTGDSIPVTGVWMPKNLKSGCPNFFVQGQEVPAAKIASKKIEAFVLDSNRKATEEILDMYYESIEVPAIWELHWKDDRYINGKIPLEEQEYLLDKDTQIPTEPPVAPGS